MYHRADARQTGGMGQGIRVPPREPSYRPHHLRVPSNYSGNAFRGEETVEPMSAESAHPHFEDLPRVSNLPATVPIEPPAEAPREEPSPDVVPALTGERSLFDGTHFPFGHGLGYEELLLLGLMVLLIKEGDGEGDTYETLLLLGVLLLCG